MDVDGFKADTKGAEDEGSEEDYYTRVLVDTPANFEEMWLEEVSEVNTGAAAVCFALWMERMGILEKFVGKKVWKFI